MSIRIRQFIPPLLLTLAIFGTSALVGAQKDGLLSGNIKYNSGQSVQPIFEGWTKNADGTYQFYYGYLNRNHVEEVQVPVGADNRVEPGGPDRGQPGYFYTRFNRQLFSVNVPANWGKKELIWTLVTHGQTERAVAWLRPDWEIAPPGNPAASGRGGADAAKNLPPTLALAGTPRITLPATLTLTATVTDDGLPAGRGGGRGGGGGGGAAARGAGGAARGAGAAGGAAPARGNANRPPAFDNSEFKATTPINVPDVERPVRPRATGRLQVEWLVWRGPGAVTFDPPAVGADAGPGVVTATFVKPGSYVLRARATDSAATTVKDIDVVVSAAPR